MGKSGEDEYRFLYWDEPVKPDNMADRETLGKLLASNPEIRKMYQLDPATGKPMKKKKKKRGY